MRAIPIAAAVVGTLGLTACDGRGGGGGLGGGMECEVLVVEDTVQVYESDGKIMAMAQRDTQPKPYARCLTLRAARDTQPRP
jgi:hypothetical protein